MLECDCHYILSGHEFQSGCARRNNGIVARELKMIRRRGARVTVPSSESCRLTSSSSPALHPLLLLLTTRSSSLSSAGYYWVLLYTFALAPSFSFSQDRAGPGGPRCSRPPASDLPDRGYPVTDYSRGLLRRSLLPTPPGSSNRLQKQGSTTTSLPVICPAGLRSRIPQHRVADFTHRHHSSHDLPEIVGLLVPQLGP